MSHSPQPNYLQIDSELSPSQLMTMLAAFSNEAIWTRNLQVQDAISFPHEINVFNHSKLSQSKGQFLDVSWGFGKPIVSHHSDFPGYEGEEVGLSLSYLFQGKTKAKQYLRDIASVVGNKKFNLIRLNLVAQHVRHHGVLLEGLLDHLEDRGRILVIDARDEMLEFNPSVPHLRDMYQRLAELQKRSGGLRNGAERIQKRASVFGYKLLDSQALRIQTKNPEELTNFFRMFCLHAEIVTRPFAGKFDRQQIYKDVFRWYQAPGAWASFGLQFVLIEKRIQRRRRQ
ncbi:MAG: hypothetical protein H6624_16375 [Bdellovibrionaceae bacterium]|nr:hypothetical protein [Bdellovibrionales bacterium]MCB9085923.1 hypothetical protein [Pseudobdellovibrionaceae bacterium]